MTEQKARNTSPSASAKKTPETPPGFVPGGGASASDKPASDPGPADSTTEERAARLQAAVDASTLESAPEDQKGPTGGSFYNPAHVGSGTILPDGTYGAPLPDPNVARLAELAEDTKDSDSQ